MLTKTILSLLLFFVTLSMNAQTPAYADTITIPILTERDTDLKCGVEEVGRRWRCYRIEMYISD